MTEDAKPAEHPEHPAASPEDAPKEIAVAIELGGDEVMFYFPGPVTNFAMTYPSIERLLEEASRVRAPRKATPGEVKAGADRIASDLMAAAAGHGAPEPTAGMTVLQGPAAAAMLDNSLNFGREILAQAQERGLTPYQVALACTTILESFTSSYGWSLELLRKSVRAAVSITETPVVHALAHGEALCGIPGVPADWPANHTWVSAFVAEDRSKISCPKCARKAALVQPGASS